MDLSALPFLGVGISTEPGSVGAGGIDATQLVDRHPGVVDFLEVGADIARGLDDHVRRWAQAGHKTTYHFLDLNLTEPGDADAEWISRTTEMARSIGAAWLCGDGGLWHVGPRDRGHETLLPPVLTRDSALEMAEAVAEVQEATKMQCLPENPPAAVYLGDMHLLEYFATVAETADCGFLLDCAHLAIYQRAMGYQPLDALDAFPLERVVEVHIAGGCHRESGGFAWIDDDHSPQPLDETWEIFAHLLPGATNLKAVVFECEKNAMAEVIPGFERIRSMLEGAG